MNEQFEINIMICQQAKLALLRVDGIHSENGQIFIVDPKYDEFFENSFFFSTTGLKINGGVAYNDPLYCISRIHVVT